MERQKKAEARKEGSFDSGLLKAQTCAQDDRGWGGEKQKRINTDAS
jgi:hypothetical protein